MILSRNTVRIWVGTAFLAAIVIGAGCSRGPGDAERLVGKWRYFGKDDKTEDTSSTVTYKLLTPTSWTLTEVNKGDGKVIKTSGGAYKLEGNTYTETVEYGTNNGMRIGFNCKLEGDKWYHSGKLPDQITFNKETGKQETFPGFPVNEVWIREK